MAVGMIMGKFDAVQASQSQLLVDLGQWKEVVFKLNGKTLAVSVSEIYESLKEGQR